MYQQEKINPYSNGEEKRIQVEAMFDNIAPTYDTLNHTLSLGTDKGWRRKAIDRLGKYQPSTILDIATGTGDFAILAAKRIGKRQGTIPKNSDTADFSEGKIENKSEGKTFQIMACDLSEGMMNVGREKVRTLGLDDVITFQKEDCLHLSFPNNSFDAVTVAYGVRNFQNLESGLKEMLRVLTPGGHLLILELATPPHFPMKQLFWLYSHVWMPLIGRLVSKVRAHTSICQPQWKHSRKAK